MIWIVPVVALLVGGYLVYREMASRGPEITITFSNGSGLEAGKTHLVSRGVSVGLVEQVDLTPDLSQVRVIARLNASAADLAREGTRCWIVRPKIGVGGITGLETIMKGPQIELDPAPDPGAPVERFQGFDEAPLVEKDGHDYVLHLAHKGTVQPGVPVLFRGLEVGVVRSVELAPDGTELLAEVRVDEPYFRLVRENTVFWDSGGVNMKVGLLGAKIRTGTLDEILSGAIEFATPPKDEGKPVAARGSHFQLHAEADEDWLKWVTPLPMMPGDEPSAEATAVE
jgi:paraquat-inducible protein B